jgi:hypothetical protein
MGLKEKLYESIRQQVIRELPYDRGDCALVSALTAKDASDLLILWINWKERLIVPRPRKVLRSPTFDGNNFVLTNRAIIQSICADIRRGDSLDKYLSKAITTGFTLPTKPTRPWKRKELDMLRGSWGIHHLHASLSVGGEVFVERRDELIFAVFQGDTAYLIDVMLHGEWAKESIIRTIVDTWPQAGLVHRMNDVVGLSWNPTDDERRQLMAMGANSLIAIDGNVYMPNGGVSTAGTSANATRQSDKVMDTVDWFAAKFEADPSAIYDACLKRGFKLPNNPDFRVEFDCDRFGIVEVITDTHLKLGP